MSLFWAKKTGWRLFETGDQVKRINIDISFNSIGTNGHKIILSTGYTRHLRDTVNFANSCVIIFSLSELVDPKIPAEEVEWREFLPTDELGEVKVEVAINQTGFVAVFPKYSLRYCQRPPAKDSILYTDRTFIMKQFDFWRGSDDIIDGVETNCLAKLKRERLKNSRRREMTRGQKKAKKNVNKKHILCLYLSYHRRALLLADWHFI